ncbi:IS110 family transposase [Candidatus Tisiphia endosymbiont of Oplodontha viridula]|uniref:IS110 family transposase n=1 Tax=Candidatus Tisiphia endosymbiont of Oplodontha viridula TaxID=3077925 RepID=UPI0035C8B973
MVKENNDKQKLEIMNPNAAGIDIGSREHYVCVPVGRDKEVVKKFAAFTSDLKEMVNWLKECKIKTIAMESTGVYWIPVFQILETNGFEVKLVNARYAKNVPGRKTDVQDCQWLQRLHSYGLLNGSFRPNDQICVLRSYVRQRDRLIKSSRIHINRMQKALNEMNIQLHHVISDITGISGMKIIKAIIVGERDAKKLAEFKDYRIKSNSETIIKALEGDYRKEQLAILKQELELYEFYLTKIEECDKSIKECYEEFDKYNGDAILEGNDKKRKVSKNAPKTFDLRQSLYNVSGIDFSKIPGFDVLTVQTMIAEVGLDMSKWKTEKHFTSWLGLSPNNQITGGKVFKTRTKKVINKASIALRMSALSLGKGKSALAGYYRRMKNKIGSPKAITATARKLACLFYRLLKYGQDYVEQGIEAYEKQYQEKMIENLRKQAVKLGFELVTIEPC